MDKKTSELKFNINEINLGFTISTFNKFYLQYLNYLLKELDITYNQGLFISLINKYGFSSQEKIAKVLKVNEASITRLVLRVEKKGLIKKQVNPEDKRAKIIVLTDQGRNLAKQFEDIDENFEKSLRDEFSDEKIKDFKYLMIDMTKSLYLKCPSKL
ncbi:MarR family winged helix-turn-helix transcriptional regulator [Methanobrevibacter sp. UBA412]|uniref:MarR family winged helix-turn-helix transcriptional regulator n=1 Tax=Methanobrevibacter sp. UBA412 TaxID=1915486 RepID=UPI0039B856A5